MIPGDQGQVNSCVAWGIEYGAMGLLENRDRGSSQFENPSNLWATGGMAPMYNYSQTVQGNDGGSSFNDNLAVATTQGNDDQSNYTQGNFDWMSQPTASEQVRASNWVLGSYQNLNSFDAIKAALAAGSPVELGIEVTPAFESNTSGYYPDPNNSDDDSTSLGTHGPVAVGYDSYGLLVENSWGPFWDQGGYVHISWDWLNGSTTDGPTTNLFTAIAIQSLNHYTPPTPPNPTPPPPAPKLTAHPFSVTKNRTATFRFTDARRGVRFQFLNGNKYQSITSPKVFRHLSFRVHTFSVRAIDSHGTSRVTTFTWRVKR
jgi:hypothetical protein